MKFNFQNLPEDYKQGLKEAAPILNIALGEDGIPVTLKSGEGLTVSLKDGKAEITCDFKHFFFRGVGILAQNAHKGEFSINEKTGIEKTGIMLDASRNAVMTVDSIKEMLRYLAVMGYGLVMLYTEDTYEVKEYKYFGYMRGRYTYEELKKCDDYADLFGIEMIPCIQALSHLEQYLRWGEAAKIKDTSDILLVGEDETYKFIEATMRAAMAPFRSKRIHLGMDEAWDLGRGKYLDRFGYRQQFEIFCDHLKRVDEIVKLLNAEPILWTSSFRHSCERDGVFRPEIAEQVKKLIPDGYSLCLTHYGENPEGCGQNVTNILSLGVPTSFGGGLWNWQGHYPEWNWAYENIIKSVECCHRNKMNEYVMTSWGNDGHECDPFAILPGLLLTAELCFNESSDTDYLRERFNFLTGGDYDAFFDMANYQNRFEEIDKNYYGNYHRRFMGKKLLWNDVLEGLADSQAIERPLSSHYKANAERFKLLTADTSRWGYLYRQAYRVFNVLAQKTYIAERLTVAYKNGDKEFLHLAASKLFPELKTAFYELYKTDREVWLSNRKVFGWSLHETRYGGMLLRIETAIKRINEYLDGTLDSLPELAEERLDISYNGFGKYNWYNHAYVW